MWFFAILVVLALGGVAVLAAGRGEPLAEVYDDRPDATVPADGPLGAEDLRRVRFSIALRGYRMSEVDALLDRLAAERETAGPVGHPVEAPEDVAGRRTGGSTEAGSGARVDPPGCEGRGGSSST